MIYRCRFCWSISCSTSCSFHPKQKPLQASSCVHASALIVSFNNKSALDSLLMSLAPFTSNGLPLSHTLPMPINRMVCPVHRPAAKHLTYVVFMNKPPCFCCLWSSDWHVVIFSICSCGHCTCSAHKLARARDVSSWDISQIYTASFSTLQQKTAQH